MKRGFRKFPIGDLQRNRYSFRGFFSLKCDTQIKKLLISSKKESEKSNHDRNQRSNTNGKNKVV
jgi:hypothetical protein